jgi:energy-coupling factor transporter ATP-binding protein EcfA2
MVDKPADDSFPTNQRGVYLHASAVNVSEKALLFLGHSTSGKSTISRLLSERYPIIADDKVRVFQKKNNDWLVCDGGNGYLLKKENTHSVSDQKKYPLLAILRIFKSRTMKINSLSHRETCRHLVDAVFEVDNQRKEKNLEIIKQWFLSLAEISKKIEGWHLTFKKDKSIIDLVHDNFEERLF